jgi:MarR family transcriptional regulator, organic hydroperoxide resistance regulator
VGDASKDDFQAVFWETKHDMVRASTAAFSQHGVHEGQQYVLMALWERDGLTPGEVAKRLGIATPTVTRTTARMAAAGLLRREPHPSDRRLVRLMLTEKGRALEETIGLEMQQLNERALAGLSAAERATLIASLRKVQANLSH